MAHPEKMFRGEKTKAFVFSALLFLILQNAHAVRVFYYDAALYWDLARPEVITDFPDTIRGYFFPLLLAPVRWLGDMFPDSRMPYRIASAIAYGYLLAVFLPDFYTRIFGGIPGFARRVLPSILVAVLFPGLILYPLSDLPAFLLLAGAIWQLEKARTGDIGWQRLAALCIAGILLGGAYNSRTIYLFPALLVALFFLFFLFRTPGGGFPRAGALAALAAGLLAVSLPQMLINKKHHDSYSPAVISGQGLFADQLRWGISVQKYGTTINPKAPGPGMFYLDRAGMKLLAGSGADRDNDWSIRKYAGLVLANPADFLGIYSRHIVSGLDVRDGEMYVKRYKSSRHALSILNFLVIFFGAWTFFTVWPMGETGHGASAFRPVWLAAILAPVVAIIPGAIETRFFLPFHLLVYCALASGWNWKQARARISASPAPFFACLLGVAALYFAIALTAQAGLEYVFQR